MRGAKVDQGGDNEEEEVRLGKVLDFMRLLWSVDHGLQSLSKRMDARLGVTGPQRLVIRIVGRFPGISPGEIADILKVHKSTLTGVLQRLEERGLIERKASPEDRRRALLKMALLACWMVALVIEALVAVASMTMPYQRFLADPA
jgi:DNA-binding MarR family transcriptional regulator